MQLAIIIAFKLYLSIFCAKWLFGSFPLLSGSHKRGVSSAHRAAQSVPVLSSDVHFDIQGGQLVVKFQYLLWPLNEVFWGDWYWPKWGGIFVHVRAPAFFPHPLGNFILPPHLQNPGLWWQWLPRCLWICWRPPQGLAAGKILWRPVKCENASAWEGDRHSQSQRYYGGPLWIAPLWEGGAVVEMTWWDVVCVFSLTFAPKIFDSSMNRCGYLGTALVSWLLYSVFFCRDIDRYLFLNRT